ncbi:MAG: hypothetical protein KDA61_16720, partial [Planctomycetales bacterium]|nr:hypothetical protein [Planctomycetales bacterium]
MLRLIKGRRVALRAALLGATAALPLQAFGQVLYSEDFDDGQASTRWTALPGYGVDADLNV